MARRDIYLPPLDETFNAEAMNKARVVATLTPMKGDQDLTFYGTPTLRERARKQDSLRSYFGYSVLRHDCEIIENEYSFVRDSIMSANHSPDSNDSIEIRSCFG